MSSLTAVYAILLPRSPTNSRIPLYAPTGESGSLSFLHPAGGSLEQRWHAVMMVRDQMRRPTHTRIYVQTHSALAPVKHLANG